jgi:hypothetical protein
MTLLLPNHVLNLIREYSKPLTRPDWRKSKPIITQYCLYLNVKNFSYAKLGVSPLDRLYHCIAFNITNTDWYFTYVYICFHGVRKYIERYHCDKSIKNVDGIQDAILYYNMNTFCSMRKCH